MNNIQNNYLAMFRAVIKHATDNQVITDLIKAFATGILALIAKVGVIGALAALQAESLSGVTGTKASKRNALDVITFSIISPARAWALATDKLELAAKLDLSQSEIQKILDDEISGRARLFHETLSPHLAELDEYGISAALMDTWEKSIDDYEPHIQAPRIAIVHRVTLTKELETAVNEARDVVRNVLDPIAIAFRKDNPHYYNDYLKASEIIDLGSTTTRIKGTVIDGATGAPIHGATVTVTQTGEPAKTDLEGNYIFTPFPIGTYVLKAEAEGYETAESPAFQLKLGTTEIVNFELVPIA